MFKKQGKNSFYSSGLKFSCTRCSNCCRHDPGHVFLSQNDLSRLEAAFNSAHEEFISTWCRWIPSAGGMEKLSLKEASNYDCIFWSEEKGENGGCSVYEARPLQCRSFPFWDTVLVSPAAWKDVGMDCPGMDRGSFHSSEVIKNWLDMQENEPFITRKKKNRGDTL